MARKFKVSIPTTNGESVKVTFWEGCRVEQFAQENGYSVMNLDKAKIAWNSAKAENGKCAFDRLTRDMVFDSKRTVRIKRNVPEVITTLKALEGRVDKSTLYLLQDKLERSEKTSAKNQGKLLEHIRLVQDGEVSVPTTDNKTTTGVHHPADSLSLSELQELLAMKQAEEEAKAKIEAEAIEAKAKADADILASMLG